MAHASYLREKARELRVSKKLTIDEIAERLALSRSTIYYWVRDLPIEGDPDRRTAAQKTGTRAMQRKFAQRREAAYLDGVASFDALAEDPTFRDFVCMYMAEGFKRDRNKVAIGNSDPAIMVLSQRWIRQLSQRKLSYAIQYHADQSLDELRRFWGSTLDIDGDMISLQRKSNSNHLTGRTWRSRHGVMTITSCDTVLRARLEAWMDRLRSEWTVELTIRGVAKPGIASALGAEDRRFESGRPDLQGSAVRKSSPLS